MSINEKQRKFIIAGVVVVILMGLFPPWTYTFKYKTAYSNEPAGYGFILAPPEKKNKAMTHGIELDMKRLSVQLVIALLATGLGVFLTATTKALISLISLYQSVFNKWFVQTRPPLE